MLGPALHPRRGSSCWVILVIGRSRLHCASDGQIFLILLLVLGRKEQLIADWPIEVFVASEF
jgi:hypothetical protein